MNNLFPIDAEEIENLRKQIRELEKTLSTLKQRLEFYEQQRVVPRIYQGGVMSPADLEQAHASTQEYSISQSDSTDGIENLKRQYNQLTETY